MPSPHEPGRASPTPTRFQSSRSRRQPHIPAGPSTPLAKPRQPTVFVLKAGEKIEVRRYTILGGLLRLTVDGKQRTIPVTDLDLKASTAANRERGINLRVPTNPNEIVIGF